VDVNISRCLQQTSSISGAAILTDSNNKKVSYRKQIRNTWTNENAKNKNGTMMEIYE